MPNLGKILSAATKAAAKSKPGLAVRRANNTRKTKAQIKAGVIPQSTSKELVPVNRQVVKYKGPMSKRKKAAIVGGVAVLGATAGNALGGPTSSESGAGKGIKTMSKSKGQPGAWDTGKNGTGRTGRAKPSGSGSSKSSGLSRSGRSYTAASGDSLWSIAEKTVPKGKSVTSWWLAIKKMNTVNGKLRRLYSGTGVSLPPGARRS